MNIIISVVINMHNNTSNKMKHVREFSVHKQSSDNQLWLWISLPFLVCCFYVILYAMEMTFYRAILIVHRACKLHWNEAQCNEQSLKQMSIA